MKKIISVILCISMLAASAVFAIPAAAAEGKIALSATGKVTDPMTGTGTFTLTISMKENTGVNTLNLKIGYNADTLEFDSITNGVVFSEENGGAMSVADTASNPIALYFEHTGYENIAATGKIVTIKFNIIDDMGEFDFTYQVDEENTYAVDGDNLPVSLNITAANDVSKTTQHVNTALPTTIKPTCTEPGRIEKRCFTCNKIISVLPNGDALGHDWDEIDRVEPTETSDGYVEYECLRCYETKTEILPKKEVTPGVIKGKYTVEEGTLTLTLDLSKNPGLNTLVTLLGYNKDALKIVSVTNGNVFCDATGGSMFTVNLENDPLLLYFDENNVGNIKANGTLATLVFEVLDENADFGFTLAVDEDGHYAVSDEYLPVDMPIEVSTVEEANFIPGDLDGDGKVNAADSNLMKKIVLGIVEPTDIQLKAGDLNGDGKINASDYNLLKKLILGIDIY